MAPCMLCLSSHGCVGGEVHWRWRCSGAHRRQTWGYRRQSLFFWFGMLVFLALTVPVYSQNKDVQSHSGAVQKMVRLKSPPGRRDREQDGDENGFLDEQNYIQALGADSMEGKWSIVWLALFYSHQIVMTEVCHVTWLCRWWWWDVQSCWILHFHISESQTWTQHGSDRWAPPSSLSFRCTYCDKTLFKIHYLLVRTFIHSKRVGSDSRENSDIRRSPRYRTIHSHTNGPRWVVSIYCPAFYLVYPENAPRLSLCVSLRPDQRSESRTPQRVRIEMYSKNI